ncbi:MULTISPECIES: SPOR domain-containing protein [unclassified Ectothiorhodospira]|uniref:SPOR domain-containing protein n=1 Tax=unclassified Ectothiorhodospira TaxID=2684909 RepID=UPI001EE8085C|nr:MULTISPECIES: SPOR domain-containing protein [unclassified Ectothiorhodospira]MCG5515300.1 SPOR domain-containing protein [Ectothiorhodospira sp. 9100]MCG5519419.1 SPOR domain-containing protein [Ectothiorhodospira sp. 9905]
MRVLFVLLVLFNLGYLGFVLWSDAPSSPSAAISPVSVDRPDVPLLQRLGEQQPPAPGSQVQASTWGCFSLGPFDDDLVARRALLDWEAAGARGMIRPAQAARPASYWVILPPHDGSQGAEAARQRLNDEGVDDHYVITEGEHEQGLSLGLFSSKERARRRQVQIQGLGLEPRVMTRYREQTVYWVDLEIHRALDVGARPAVGPGLQWQARVCP